MLAIMILIIHLQVGLYNMRMNYSEFMETWIVIMEYFYLLIELLVAK